VAAPSSVWQRFPLRLIESNVNENFKVIQNPGFLPDYTQNWITGSFYHSWHSQKISERSVHNFLSYLADTQTDRQTDKVRQKHNLLGRGNKPDSNTCQCHGMVYRLSMSTRHKCSTIFPIMYLPDLPLAIFQCLQNDRRSTVRILAIENPGTEGHEQNADLQTCGLTNG